MKRIVIRPWIQVPLLVVVFAVFGAIGVSFFTNGDVTGGRDWFGMVLGVALVPLAALAIWRALRLGVVIDATGIRVRGFDSRDQFTPWSQVRAVECEQIDARAGLPIYGPLIHIGEAPEPLAVRALGSYSRSNAERTVAQLRGFMNPDGASPVS